MSEITDLVWALTALAGVLCVLILVLWLALRNAGKTTTAGEQVADELDAIDDKTREEIENAPDEPAADYADAADDRVRDLADQIGTDAGDGFQSEPVDSNDIEWHDDLLPPE